MIQLESNIAAAGNSISSSTGIIYGLISRSSRIARIAATGSSVRSLHAPLSPESSIGLAVFNLSWIDSAVGFSLFHSSIGTITAVFSPASLVMYEMLINEYYVNLSGSPRP